MPNYNHTKKEGFTLIELSIVMVIIGLIIGGIIVGVDLIKSSQNRAFVSQIEKINASVNTFKNKYNCLPGDCSNATTLGFSGNGNGNSMVTGVVTEPSWSVADYRINSSDTFVSTYLSCCSTHESQYFWNHLRTAQLFSNFMTPIVVSDGVASDYRLAKAANDNSGIVVSGWAGKHYYKSGAVATRAGGNVLYNVNFTPKDAAYIFEKMGGKTINTATTYGNLYPDDLGRELVLVSGFSASPTHGNFDLRLYQIPSRGTGGTNSDFCISTSITPPYFNVQNPKKLCSLIIQANF